MRNTLISKHPLGRLAAVLARPSQLAPLILCLSCVAGTFYTSDAVSDAAASARVEPAIEVFRPAWQGAGSINDPGSAASATEAQPKLRIEASRSAYLYPHQNPYLATVAGTPEQLAGGYPSIKLKVKKLKVGEARANPRPIPKVLRYGRRFEFSYATQPGPAPLIFVVAGTGGYHNGSTNLSLMEAFYANGFHVVGITSPTHPGFIIAASESGVPGNLQLDALDIHRVMGTIVTKLPKATEITGYHLTGYSLGGIHAAFIAHHDAEAKKFDFERVVLINSPVSLYSSISKLDRLLDNIPGGVDNFNQYFTSIVRQIGDAYTRSTNIEFNQDLIYSAFQARPPTNEELAALIGSAFRLAAANMIFTADLMTDFGFIKPKEVVLQRKTSMADYLQVALRVGLTDYFHEFYWPVYQKQYPNMSRQQFARTQSLHHLRDFLASADYIEAVHNQDDIILAADEINFFPEVFGERAKIYPVGGHLGNITQRETIAHIVGTGAGQTPPHTTRAGGAP